MTDQSSSKKRPSHVSRGRVYGLILIPILLGLAVWGIWLALKSFPATMRVGTTLVATGAIVFFGLWKVPQWQISYLIDISPEARFNLENEARRTLAQIVGGVILLAGLYGTWHNLTLTQESLSVSREGQITDRFTKAVAQLGDKKIEVRLGGIYALERIANESERDHWPIIEVLTAYVRNSAPLKKVASSKEKNDEIPAPSLEVQAILTVLGRRDRRHESPNQFLELSQTNLRKADLQDAEYSRARLIRADLRNSDLSRAHFRGADLHGSVFSLNAHLRQTDLTDADLSVTDLHGADLLQAQLSKAQLIGSDLRTGFLYEANLRGANLRAANLYKADLTKADLNGADLSEANLREAQLGRAMLRGAHLTGCKLAGAVLTDSVDLTQEQVDQAHGDKETMLPSKLRRPDSWKVERRATNR